MVEICYFKNDQTLEVSEQEAKMNLTVTIHHCEDVTIQVKGKVKVIVIESCKMTNVLLNSVVAQVEIIHGEKL